MTDIKFTKENFDKGVGGVLTYFTDTIEVSPELLDDGKTEVWKATLLDDFGVKGEITLAKGVTYNEIIEACKEKLKSFPAEGVAKPKRISRPTIRRGIQR